MDSRENSKLSGATLQIPSSISEERLTADTVPPTPFEQEADYDPCKLAKIASPFYLYNHDSPRPSADLRHGKPSLAATERDMELGEITPSVTQEKITAQEKQKKFNLKFWQKRQECLTKPKKQWWLQRLPKKQRYAVKALIALVIVGAMIGIAVGIASAVNSPVNGSDKTVGDNQ